MLNQNLCIIAFSITHKYHNLIRAAVVVIQIKNNDEKIANRYVSSSVRTELIELLPSIRPVETNNPIKINYLCAMCTTVVGMREQNILTIMSPWPKLNKTPC